MISISVITFLVVMVGVNFFSSIDKIPFTCNNGLYSDGILGVEEVTIADLTDGKHDCADGSDEVMADCCGGAYSKYDAAICGGGCNADQLACNDGGCFPASVFCDGTPDCADGSDEFNCGGGGTGGGGCGTYLNNSECNTGGCFWVINPDYPNGHCWSETEAMGGGGGNNSQCGSLGKHGEE